MRRVLIVFLLIEMLIPSVYAQHTFEIFLVLNNTENTVYIPGIGELPSSGLGPIKSYIPEHFYIASYSNNFLTGLVAKHGLKIMYGSEGEFHTLGIQQNLDNSRIFLPVTLGDWRVIERRIPLIEAGKFLIEFSPVFGFSMSSLYSTVVMLKYAGINLTGDEILGKGRMKLIMENLGVNNGNVMVRIGKS